MDMDTDVCTNGHSNWYIRANGNRRCRDCANDRRTAQRRAKGMKPRAIRANGLCARGHDNWYIRPNGTSSCRDCRNLSHNTKYWERRFKQDIVLVSEKGGRGRYFSTSRSLGVIASRTMDAEMELTALIEDQAKDQKFGDFVWERDEVKVDAFTDTEGMFIDSGWDYITTHLSPLDPHYPVELEDFDE